LTIPGSDGPDGLGRPAFAVDDVLVGRAPGAIWRDGDFGVVVLGRASYEPVTLAGTGVAIWDALARPRRRVELVELLAARFAADAEDVARDVAPVLDALVTDGALELVGAASAGQRPEEP
jgi:hypothetical protein